MPLKQVMLHGKMYYDVCPNCKHWDKEKQVCKIDARSERKPLGNLLSCKMYDDSHTRPNDWEMGMG